MAYDPGDVWTPGLEVRDSDGDLTASDVTVTVTAPDGTSSTPSVSTASTGIYTASPVSLDQSGRWLATWTVSGTVTGVETQNVYVRRLGSNIISVDEIRARLNKTLTVDDAEIEDMLEAALAEYEEHVGPVSGTVTERLNGGGTSLILRNPSVAEVTAAAYTDGTEITLTDLDLDTATGILHWGYGTTGRFTYGTRNVTVTYTVGALPANHRETIIADVAGYFEATQRSDGAGQADFPGEGGFESAFSATPQVLFPRIRALRTPSIA